MGSQRGSVLVYILIAVALFAALGFAVSTMMRGSGNIGDEKGGILVSEILSYGRSLREAAQGVKISAVCEDGQISFERAPFDGSDKEYVNAAAPTNFSCHIFHPDGGGVGYQDGFDGRAWRFTGTFGVKGVGTSAPDLIAVLPVKRGICEQINKRVEISNDDIMAARTANDGVDSGTMPRAFDGNYNGTAEIDLPAYEGKMVGCYLSSGSDGNEFTVYQVLVSR